MAKTRGFSKAFGLTFLAAVAALAVLAASGHAQAPKLQADPNASKSNQPTVTTPNPGKAPSVNIVTPGKGGVSHNVWKDYNVGKEGIVFNNATQAGQSQLLGQLGANPNLANGNYAKLILNEVTGGNISQLLGYTEIFGHSADFILANPAGVTCNGCGFINTPRVTLTTGLADFNADGTLKGFNVSGSGSITIDTGGANIKGVETFDLVSRSIFMGGAIDDSALAAEVGLFAGPQQLRLRLAHGDGAGRRWLGEARLRHRHQRGGRDPRWQDRRHQHRKGCDRAHRGGHAGGCRRHDADHRRQARDRQGALARSDPGQVALRRYSDHGPALVAGLARPLGGRQHRGAEPGFGGRARQRQRQCPGD